MSPPGSQPATEPYDVAVVGGGNAALCAALTAAGLGARVLVLESAPREMRGGNSRHTRNLRYVHDTATDVLTGPYTEGEFWDDLVRVTEGDTDEAIARCTLRGSRDVGRWMVAHGARFQPSLKGTLHLSRTNAFFLGGGRALLNAYYHTAERMGVRVEYGAEVRDVDFDGEDEVTLRVAGRRAGGEAAGSREAPEDRPSGEGGLVPAPPGARTDSRDLRAKAVVVASGGFQANLAWLAEAWGPAAENFVVRGSPYDTGLVLRALLDRGVRRVGDPRQCHCIAVDARAPRFDGGIVTRLDCVPFGIVVNRRCERFYDEGEDFWPKRYAIWGRLIAEQPDQIAWSIVDARADGLFMPSVFPPVEADSIGALAAALGLDADRLAGTVSAFNAAARPGAFDPAALDGCRTEGLEPAKSHWARPLDRPPFRAYPLRPGITFTYLGVKVDERARVVRGDGRPLPHVFAAGEVMAGNVLGRGYLAGLGMTIGTVFGRIAGGEAAARALG